jgi:hypothetical protein
VARNPRQAVHLLERDIMAEQARNFCRQRFEGVSPRTSIDPALVVPEDTSNRLWAYFTANNAGPGIWKWTHYFDIYQRHLGKFVGRDAHIVEVGIYSGGSLPMWRNYFGPKSQITGIDIEQACRCYEQEGIRVSIGDQADRGFWKSFRESSTPFDVMIDDGGHSPLQQRITLEETLPYLKPGGVYMCEDVHRIDNEFAAYTFALTDNLNALVSPYRTPTDDSVCPRTGFQNAVLSVHFYPYAIVIERSDRDLGPLVAPKKGTEWQPWLR